jgi:hypothetical protein
MAVMQRWSAAMDGSDGWMAAMRYSQCNSLITTQQPDHYLQHNSLISGCQ